MTNTTKFIQARKYFFAEMVADADHWTCKQGLGPYVLTLAKARHFYVLAAGKARRAGY
jgi:hypothetical protein